MNMRWNPGQFSTPHAESRPAPGIFLLTGLVLASSLIAGGASRENDWQVIIIELLSLPLLGLAVLNLTGSGDWRTMRVPLAIMAGILLIPLVQLVPLPYGLWRSTPGRELAAEALALAGADRSWRPLSLAPHETLSHWLALLPPVAAFLGVACLSPGRRKQLCVLVPVIAIASLLLGAAQVVAGDSSRLYLYETTNAGAAVGLFSNRNHQAALLLTALPLVALWIDLRGHDPRRRLIPAAAALSVLMLVILGLVIVKSRAGVLLLVPSLMASLALVWRGEAGAHRQTLVAVGGVVVVAVFVGAVFALGPVLERFGGDEVDGRLRTAPIVIQAAAAHLPVGSGVGSFVPVFAGREPIETMAPQFWNHAHNDYLELWLEAGVLAAAALLAFIFWWLRAAILAWRAPLSLAATLARVGTIVTALLLIHSTVDYPLRTLALSTLFAFSCALMLLPRNAVEAARAAQTVHSRAQPEPREAPPGGPRERSSGRGMRRG